MPQRQKPEEAVRQSLLVRLTQELGFPEGLIVVERALSSLPHLQHQSDLPDRRVDILCYALQGTTLVPLLLIECKAVPLTAAVLEQALGYNAAVGAPFIAVANGTEVKCGGFDCATQAYRWIPALPRFDLLLNAI